jgi:DNA-binding response OmpR family regulator
MVDDVTTAHADALRARLHQLLTAAVAPPDRIAAFIHARAGELDRLRTGDDAESWSRSVRGDLLVFLGRHDADWQEAVRPRRIPVLDGEAELTGREFLVFQALAGHRGQWLTRAQLLELAWPDESGISENAVSVYVGYLRRKLGPGAIETQRGVGYRMP